MKKMKYTVIILLSLIVVVGCSKNSKFPQQLNLEFGNTLSYNQNTINDSLANSYANYLKSEGFFTKDAQSIAIEVVSEPKRMFKFYIVDKVELHKKPQAIVDAKVLARHLSNEIFENNPVEVIFSDDKFQPIKTLEPEKSIGPRVKLDGNEVIYNETFTMEGAYIVANFLKDNGFFKPNGGQSVMVEISQRKRMNLYIVTDDSFSMTEEKFRETQKFGAIISYAIYSGQPVDVVYTNRLMKPRNNGVVFFNPATAAMIKDPKAKEVFAEEPTKNK